MKSVLIGNGIDIQYGGKDYLNGSIIKRGLKKISIEDIPVQLYNKEIGLWLEHLYDELEGIVTRGYDTDIRAEYEKYTLNEIKKRYRNWKKVKIHDVGIEDYIFIHNLLCRKLGIENPEQNDYREFLKRFFIDAIYNVGKINTIYLNFPESLKVFLNEYDEIFTTNYDKNLEIFLDKKINYLHGAFHILAEVYNPESFRNKMPDNPLSKCDKIEGHDHIYSNALMTFSGDDKMFSMEMYKNANQTLNKIEEGLKNNLELAVEVESWKDYKNKSVANMYEAVHLKRRDGSLSFNEYYPVDKFKNITGTIDILGLSSNNDNHLFNIINNNEKITNVRYYFFSKDEGNSARKIFKNKIVETLPVKGLWGNLR